MRARPSPFRPGRLGRLAEESGFAEGEQPLSHPFNEKLSTLSFQLTVKAVIIIANTGHHGTVLLGLIKKPSKRAFCFTES
jgi:hypothetical protein